MFRLKWTLLGEEMSNCVQIDTVVVGGSSCAQMDMVGAGDEQ